MDIATRLDTAWRLALETRFANKVPTVADIKALKRGDALAAIEETKNGRAGVQPHFDGENAKKRPKAMLICEQNGGAKIPEEIVVIESSGGGKNSLEGLCR